MTESWRAAMTATRIISEMREKHLPRKLRTPMDVVPGNIIHAGETEVVRCFRWRRRSLHDRRSVVRQTIEDAAERAKSPVIKSPMMMLMHTRSAGEGRTRRSSACAAHWSGIGKCLARGKDKRDNTERGEKRRSIGHGSHPFVGYWAAFPKR